MGRVLVWIAVVAVALAAFAYWYRATYSMGVARAFTVEGPVAGPRVLIATQGSRFKDAVVARVVEGLKARKVSLSVIDVSSLSSVNDDEWNAIVLIHTWEMGKPPPAVRAFVDRAQAGGRIVALTTSGDGDYRLAGVDAIASASRDEDVSARADAIVQRVSAILDASPGSE